jgi:hypothetical protein
MNDSKFQSLLYAGEGTMLDFKQQQYPFVGADDDQKAELLKDILAFANAWRPDDAYILIGVRAVVGGRAELVGTDEHFDDAQLQEFVSKKTNRAVTLSYEVIVFDGKKIGVIRIPKQLRPTYLIKEFGMDRGAKDRKLKANTVYYRQGSSTFIATPQDIYRMGADEITHRAIIPTVDLQFTDFFRNRLIGPAVKIKSKIILYEANDIPDLAEPGWAMGGGIVIPLPSIEGRHNRDFFREAASYLSFKDAFVPIGLAIRNPSDMALHDARVEIQIHKSSTLFVATEDEAPRKPEKVDSLLAVGPSLSYCPTVSLRRYDDRVSIIVNLGKIQAKQAIFSAAYFFIAGPKDNQSVRLEATIYTDELPEPQRIPLTIATESLTVTYTWPELRGLISEKVTNVDTATFEVDSDRIQTAQETKDTQAA